MIKILLLSLIVCTISLNGFDYSHEYIKTVGDLVIGETYKLERSQNEVIRTYVSGSRFYQSFNDSVNTRKLVISDPVDQLEITAERIDNRLYLLGSKGDRRIEKYYELDDAPWYQAISYSLYAFILSDQQRVKFWFLRTDKFKVYKMQALKKEVEDVIISGKPVRAQKVQVKLTGLLSSFWHSHYWFRLEDGLYVKYEGVNGPPGTPLTRIILKE